MERLMCVLYLKDKYAVPGVRSSLHPTSMDIGHFGPIVAMMDVCFGLFFKKLIGS